MQISQSTLDELISNSAPVVLGGIIAFLGTFIAAFGSFLIYWLNHLKEKKQLKQRKLEELLTLAYQIRDWAIFFRRDLIQGKDPKEIIPPINPMKVIATIYLPHLKSIVEDYTQIALQHSSWAFDFAKRYKFEIPKNPREEEFTVELKKIIDALTKLEKSIMKEVKI